MDAPGADLPLDVPGGDLPLVVPGADLPLDVPGGDLPLVVPGAGLLCLRRLAHSSYLLALPPAPGQSQSQA